MRITEGEFKRLRVVGTRKQGKETICQCPRCPPSRQKASDARLEFNIEKQVAFCFRCGLSFSVKLNKSEARAVNKTWSQHQEPSSEILPVPSNLHKVFIDRGCDPQYTISRYNVGFDGHRLVWPMSEGVYNKRAIYDWDTPKVLFSGNNPHHYVGGEHLMGREKYVVLTEGEWKAASIPLPWIGIWIGGIALTPQQLRVICYHRPALVIVALDGGEDPGRIIAACSKKLVPAKAWELPEEKGPDDILAHERVEGLLRIST